MDIMLYTAAQRVGTPGRDWYTVVYSCHEEGTYGTLSGDLGTRGRPYWSR